MNSSTEERTRQLALVSVLVGAGLLFVFRTVGEYKLRDFFLQLGGGNFPTPLHLGLMVSYAVLGTAALVFIVVGVVQLLAARGSRGPVVVFERGTDFVWIAVCAGLALIIPAAIRAFVLEGAPITDDESMYRFSAQLLSHGRLWVASHPDSIFFDQSFLVNGDRMYTQYFLGWPALMAPFVKFGVEGFANSVYSAATVPALYLLIQRIGGPLAARIGVVLFVTSPMIMMGAATAMAHTTCMGALVWATWFALRSREPEGGNGSAVGLAIAFCIAFFIRPLTAISIGGPVLLYWLMGVAKMERGLMVRRAIAIGVPAAVMGVLFLIINYAQNGAVTKTAYAAALDYARENGFRFTHWTAATTMAVSIDPSLVLPGLAQQGTAIIRLNFATFGWPFSFALAMLALGARRTAVFWCMFPLFFLTHLTIRNVGVDAFGPVHYFELALPIIVLTSVGVVRAREGLSSILREEYSAVSMAPAVTLLVCIGMSLLLYWPPRLQAFGSQAEVTNMVIDAPARAGIERGVIFAPVGMGSFCRKPVTRGWVYWKPTPDPFFEDDVIWANHISVEVDKRLMRFFPGRQGYVMHWTPMCNVHVTPIDEVNDETIPLGRIGGTGIVPPPPDADASPSR